MKPPFRLVPDMLSVDTAACTRELADDAAKGKLIGIGFVAMYKDRTWISNVAGECERNPTWTRGMIAKLDDQLAELE